MYFCTSVYFKTSEKTPTDPDKISKELHQINKQALGKIALNFRLTYNRVQK
jgi:hypothetical protein